ncbi:MAG: hypothetical protein JJ974_05205 [Phycisphaerales bacterium]|nr:hypothetical protein [Phycisphaerales bacterium]
MCVLIGIVQDGRADDAVVNVGTVSGVIETVGVEGVTLRVERGDDVIQMIRVPWYEIRESDEEWVVPEEFEEFHRVVAIGHARRMRGDLRGCAVLYRSVAGELMGSASETATEVFQGLLDEALLRDDFYDAAIALGGVGTGSRRVDGLDERYGLLPSMPLVYTGVGEHALGTLAGSVIEEGGAGGVMVRSYGVVFEQRDEDVISLIEELRAERGTESGDRLGLELIAQMLTAQKHPESEAREDARRWLVSRAGSRSASWVGAWCRLGAGASYFYEASDDQAIDDAERELMRSRGVIELSYVMVEKGRVDDRLVLLAHQLAVQGLLDGGRYSEAESLQNDADTFVRSLVEMEMSGSVLGLTKE